MYCKCTRDSFAGYKLWQPANSLLEHNWNTDSNVAEFAAFVCNLELVLFGIFERILVKRIVCRFEDIHP